MAATVGEGTAARPLAGVAAALWAAICSLASLRSFLRIRIWSCIVLTKHSILVSFCSSRIFFILLAAATTSSMVRCPNFWTSVARVLSNAPKKASTAWRSVASSSRLWSRLASFSALPASSTMSLEPFLRFLRAAQASFLTESMPRRVSNASLASSQEAGEDAGACGANEELTPSDFICVLSDFSELEPLVQLC